MASPEMTNEDLFAPIEKRPKATNASIRHMFGGIDKVLIKEDGVYNGKAISDKVLLCLTQPEVISRLNQLLEINEAMTGFYCMCLGSYAIELHAHDTMKHIIGLHHGTSIRYDGWNGDAELSKNEELLVFLSEQGLSQPLEAHVQQKKSMEANQIAQRNWLEIAPKTFRKYWDQISNMDADYLPTLIQDLHTEMPDQQQLIIVLLQTFGKTDKYWSAYPHYESVPDDILKIFDVRDIIRAYIQSDRNYKTRRGLGRFLCSHDFKKNRKKFIQEIPLEVISDLEKCFDHIGETRGINEMFSLRREKEKA
ncbi:hypothetical protein [Chitinophaga varians]|uniref:hypothetical protein n=1 Tax=Chitinophaga varians TaxID=2202339 RepID=UPI00165F9C19|nr:hypothetical protein [Chitinophaga varians]MBC9911573.1 hypothetical protein [Chitinophaga varians]